MTKHEETAAKAREAGEQARERQSAAQNKRLEAHYGRPLEDLSDTEVSEAVKLFERVDMQPERHTPRVNPQPRATRKG